MIYRWAPSAEQTFSKWYLLAGFMEENTREQGFDV